jgi:hypothetical protein
LGSLLRFRLRAAMERIAWFGVMLASRHGCNRSARSSGFGCVRDSQKQKDQ